jgi:hypothetical protein
MNMLIDVLPTEIVLSGVRVPVRSNFRVWMQLEELFNDEEVDQNERLLLALNLVYENLDLISDLNEAVQGLLWFYRCGEPVDKRLVKRAEKVGVKRIYDFAQDAQFIYAAFMEQYHIDLCDIEYLHWWKFKAMFNSLSDDCMISKIIGYRATELSGLDPKTRNAVAQKQALYRLRNGKSEEEKAAMLFDPTAY